MLRRKIFSPLSHEKFRHRSEEILRIEALSDAVFAFSVSLLVVSLEVPQTFHELKIILNGALPFFATVSLLFLFWYTQYIFFRRYGLDDFKILLLNLAYLAIILFYVYPLKFLFSLLISSWTGINLFPKAAANAETIITINDFPQLIILFSIGYFLIWLIIYLMHKRALQFAGELELNNYEILFTKKEIAGAMGNALIGIAAVIFALLNLTKLSGICYLFIPVILIANEWVFKRRLKKPKPLHKKG